MIIGVNHITLAVRDLNESFNFYCNILGCIPLVRWRKGCYLLAGEMWLCLITDPNLYTTVLPEYTHIAFTVEENCFQKLSAKILAAGCKVWKDNTSEGASFYFLDPNQHKLEIHVMDWKARLRSLKIGPYEEMIFYSHLDEIIPNN